MSLSLTVMLALLMQSRKTSDRSEQPTDLQGRRRYGKRH